MNVDAVGIYTRDVIEVVVARAFPLRNSRVMGIPVSTSQAQQFGKLSIHWKGLQESDSCLEEARRTSCNLDRDLNP